MALSLFSKGKSFIGAAVLLQRQPGADGYVVLHLLCQGTQIILKSALLLLDRGRYRKPLRKYGHNLESLAVATSQAFNLSPMRAPLAQELQALNQFYSNNLLRYDGLQDIFIHPATIQSDRVLRRVAAIIRLMYRELGSEQVLAAGLNDVI